MTRTYTYTINDALRHELYWIISDQAADFDDELRMPVRDRFFVQTQAQQYFERKTALPSDSDIKLLYDAFDAFLSSLREHGEDPERLILWHASMQEIPLPSQVDFGRISIWKPVLDNWARGWETHPRHLPRSRFDAFVATYRENVVEPDRAFSQRVEASAKEWLAGKRTQWDDYLWRLYFEDQDEAPSLFFGLDMEVVYFRRWWRAHRDFLTPAEKELLFSDLMGHIQADKRGSFEFIDWNEVLPIDEAIDIDNIPDFDRLKRDW